MRAQYVQWSLIGLVLVLIVVQSVFLWQIRQPQDVSVVGYHPSPVGDYKGLSAGHIAADTLTVSDRMVVGHKKNAEQVRDIYGEGTLAVDGSVYASEDVCTDAKGGRCLSDGMVIGGFYFTKYRKGCMAPNPLTGTCSCPAGYKATGFHYVESSKQYVYWLCWR